MGEQAEQGEGGEGQRGGFGDLLGSMTDHGGNEGVNIQTVDELVPVHIGFRQVWTAEQHFDKRVDIKTVHFAVEVYITK